MLKMSFRPDSLEDVSRAREKGRISSSEAKKWHKRLQSSYYARRKSRKGTTASTPKEAILTREIERAGGGTLIFEEPTAKKTPQTERYVSPHQSLYWTEEHTQQQKRQQFMQSPEYQTKSYAIQYATTHPEAKPTSNTAWDKLQKKIDLAREKVSETAEPYETYIRHHEGKVPISKAWVYPTVAGLGVLSTAGGLTKAVTNPLQTVKGIGYAITHPIEIGGKIASHAKTRPVYFAGEMAAFYGASKVVGYGIKKMPKIKYDTFKVAVGKSKVDTLYKGISWEYKSKGGGIIGISKGKVKLGTPKVNLKGTKGAFIPETPLQREILFKSLTKTQTLKPRLAYNVMKTTYKTPSKFVQKKFILDSKTLTPKEIKTIIKWSKQNKAEVYGSFPARSQMPKSLSRPFGDIDLFIKVSGKQGQAKALSLSKSLGKGFKIQKGTTLIEKKVGGKYVHAVDIHTLDSTADVLSPAYASQKVMAFHLTRKC